MSDMQQKAQKIADQHQGQELVEALDQEIEALDASCGRECVKEFLNTEIQTTVWHSTRRRESDEELKKNGFCTYEPKQVEEWMVEALAKAIVATDPGPRKRKELEQSAHYSAKVAYEPWRRQVSVSGLKEESCGWGFRNPELVHDFLFWATPGPDFNRILVEMFGEPRRIEINTNVKVQELLHVQDIHLPRLCIKPEDIVRIEPCPTRAEEIKHFPKTARSRMIAIEDIVLSRPPVESEVIRLMALIKADTAPSAVLVTAHEDKYEVYPGSLLPGHDELVEAQRRLGYTKVAAKVA